MKEVFHLLVTSQMTIMAEDRLVRIQRPVTSFGSSSVDSGTQIHGPSMTHRGNHPRDYQESDLRGSSELQLMYILSMSKLQPFSFTVQAVWHRGSQGRRDK